MTKFSDTTGISDVKALKLNGATNWIGTSANASSVRDLSGSVPTIGLMSFTNYSANAAVFDCNNTTAAVNAKAICQLAKLMKDAGFIHYGYDGTE